MKKLSEYAMAIAFDFHHSTFTFINESTLSMRLRGEHEFDELRKIIRKHLGDVKVYIKKCNIASGPHDFYNIYIVQNNYLTPVPKGSMEMNTPIER